MKKENEKVIPKHLQIETINGFCTARCIMCTIYKCTRTPNKMTIEQFETIVRKFIPYIDHLEFLSVFGGGEPLLDPELPEKISIASELGFRGIGFATNCTELDEKMSVRLLESGLNTLICSIDGIDKETHEAIRRRTNFERVVENVKSFIKIRNSIGESGTRILVRFIRQKLNRDQWPQFHDEWMRCINPEKGDDVIRFDVHDCGGELEDFEEMDYGDGHVPGDLKCSDITERFMVYSNGDVALCCADLNCSFGLGNVLTEDPIEIYNNATFSKYREFVKAGRIKELAPCDKCTIIRSHMTKSIPKRKHAVAID